MNKFRGQCEVTVDGKKLSMTFSTYTFFLFCEKMGVDLNQMGEALAKPTAIGILIWCGLKTQAVIDDKECSYNVVDVIDFISSLEEAEMAKINTAIETAMKSVSNPTGESDKKK